MRNATKIAALAAAACLAAFASSDASAQQTDVALVYRLLQDGQMLVIPTSGAQRPARLGDRLRNNDIVATSPSTRAALRFTDDGSILRLNPGARLRLTSGDERGVVVRTLQLEFGEVWAQVTHRDNMHLRISTPAGVAAVKGTQFVVRVDDNGTTVITLDGVVEFFNDAGRVDLPAGQKVTVASRAEAPRAQPATAQELRQAETVSGGEGGGPQQGEWIEVQLRDASGQARSLLLRVPGEAVRERLEVRP
jgi:hypothetical protein